MGYFNVTFGMCDFLRPSWLVDYGSSSKFLAQF